MKREFIIVSLSLCVCGCFLSCVAGYKQAHVEDYIVFLEKHDSILKNEALIGWSASATRIEKGMEIYVLRYNLYDPWLKGREGLTEYLNIHNLATGEQNHNCTNDTIALCREWNIDVNDYPRYIDYICKSFYTLVHEYRINEIQFFRNGDYFISSIQNGWNLYYMNDSISQDIKEHESDLLNKGYSRKGESNYWIKPRSRSR